MAEKNTTDDVGFPPIPLLANGYDFGALRDASIAAGKEKDEEKRNAALAELPTKMAENQEVIEGANKPAAPEGTEIKEVELEDGRKVTTPVAIPGDEPEKKGTKANSGGTGSDKPADESNPTT